MQTVIALMRSGSATIRSMPVMIPDVIFAFTTMRKVTAKKRSMQFVAISTRRTARRSTRRNVALMKSAKS